MDDGRRRTTREVLDDHLQLRREGDLEADLARNYSHDCVMLTCHGTLYGHDGVRHSARLLSDDAPGNEFSYDNILTHGDIGFLEWSVQDGDTAILRGADSFVIRDSLIRVQTVSYRLLASDGDEQQ